jgi:hypothetical protein
MVEGPEAWRRFEGVMKGVLTAPRSEIKKRIEEHRKRVVSSPKRKTKPLERS